MAISANLNIMMQAAEKAARSLLRDFGEIEQLQVSVKGPGDFVTAADKRSEEIIYKELSKARPSFGFLMEETGDVKGADGEHRFIIDPLDGTHNFMHGIPHWNISIGLERNNEVIAGVIYDPTRNEMFWAEKGYGAFMQKKRLRVSGRAEPTMVGSCMFYSSRAQNDWEEGTKDILKLQQLPLGVRQFGAFALDLAYVAAGRLDACFEKNGPKEWDIAAGSIIVKEAGGYISSLDPKQPNPVYSRSVLASNALVHQNMLKLVKSA
ncbi:MAG: inositol monophosphatase [Alphaproteobacteria bacterium]|nr:inositol monophosphatase [Alphaproteobacteria bacterium]